MSANSEPIRKVPQDGCAILVHAPSAQLDHVGAALRMALSDAEIVCTDDPGSYAEALRSTPWSLVVVSLDLGTDTGLRALAEARASTNGALIGLSEQPRTSDVVAAMRAGAGDFIGWDALPDLGAAAVQAMNRAASGAMAFGAPVDEPPGGRRAVLAVDAHWSIASCNAEVRAVLGYDPRALVGQPLDTVLADVPGGAEMVRRLRGAVPGAPVRDEGWMSRSDGLHMRAEVTCVRDAGVAGSPPPFVLYVRDITLQYRASLAVRHQADHAATTAAGRNLFIGSVAHELRSALAPIATSAVILERQRQPPEMQDKLVGIVRRNVKAAARLVEDLLEFSTRTASKMVLRPTVVNLHQLLMECSEPARHQAAQSGIRFKLQFGSSQALSQVQADGDRIRQVVTNLLGNALKFTPAGGSVTLRTAAESDTFSIEVADTGVGIEPSVLPFIFDPFEQGGQEMTQRHGGFGLGLAISSDIARQHGGQLSAWSAGQGRGTTFRLTIPRRGLGADAGAAPSPSTGLHVLYVEDDADAADAMRYALGTIGWSMLHAPTCAEARKLFSQQAEQVDVVLADLGLPDGSGLSLGTEMGPRVPVVALTAYGAPLALDGFADQLIKPAEISEVQRALSKAVAMRRNAAFA